MKSQPFYIPEALKRYPFKAAPPCIGRYRPLSPPLGVMLNCKLKIHRTSKQQELSEAMLLVIDLYLFVILGRIFISYK